MVEGKKDITVVMPALNEEASIRDAVKSTVEAFNTNGLDGEVVVINDGSTDSTAALVGEMTREDGSVIRLLEHPDPLGIGRSFWDGVRAAQGEGITMIPGDNENDPNEILRYTKLLDSVDAVVPFVVNKDVRARSRNMVSALFRSIINFTFRTSFRYTNGTVIYRTEILKDIDCKSGGFFFQAETLIKISRKGYLIAEVPYFLSQRKGGVSKALTVSSLGKVTRDYIRLIGDIYFSGKYSKDIRTLAQSSKRVTRDKRSKEHSV